MLTRRSFLKRSAAAIVAISLPFSLDVLTPTVAYGDISPKTAARAMRRMLEKAHPLMVVDKFGSRGYVPWHYRNTETVFHNGKNVKFIRYKGKHKKV